jgi:tRNA(Ile)-lysidine synthetase-like protein
MSEAAPAPSALRDAVVTVPAGTWAVGVSGGADSVALLMLLLRHRAGDVAIHVVHLDHETRGQQSADDAIFVEQLCRSHGIPCTVARRSEIEPTMRALPRNSSARYRAMRLELFRRVVREHSLAGVMLAHHADDQAETVLHRLIRGSGYTGLIGMASRTTVAGLIIQRPLLQTRREQLHEYLKQRGIGWREDASNRSGQYLRNRLRRMLTARPPLLAELLALSHASKVLCDWARRRAPVLDDRPYVVTLARLPDILAAESTRRWLLERGVPADALGPGVIDRLLTMARDAASAVRQDFPSNLRIRRRAGRLIAEARR